MAGALLWLPPPGPADPGPVAPPEQDAVSSRAVAVADTATKALRRWRKSGTISPPAHSKVLIKTLIGIGTGTCTFWMPWVTFRPPPRPGSGPSGHLPPARTPAQVTLVTCGLWPWVTGPVPTVTRPADIFTRETAAARSMFLRPFDVPEKNLNAR
ncbi:hypothetical protein GCM10007964_50590 [Sphaerisporangium melleum]|uniref:Uncharacterized protein n=1 Tax=Sphaerisporangium melleum TaxID=321316 RepID=A0A917RD73_9ACTN|nr:hypothetical protein GCM10007964_50590 [Sphaerisporangium melleum]